MSRPKVVILGCTGMLGAVTLDWFAGTDKFDIIATHRGGETPTGYPGIEFRSFDAETPDVAVIETAIEGAKWVINAIGIIKPYIHDDNAAEVERAIRVNALFPQLLAQAAHQTGAKVIQIATDCVYSGQQGKYKETDLHDALDVYGKTKSLGEAYYDNCLHLRCSIIGPELKGHLSLLDWFLGQDQGAKLNGFTNHSWNGVTTLTFARIADGIIEQNIKFDHLQHVVPGNLITKADLLKAFARDFKRPDIVITPMEAPKVIDRTLATENNDLNTKLWLAAGYETAPTIEDMISELADYGFVKAVAKS